MLEHNESYSKTVRCSQQGSDDKLQAVEGEKGEVEAILSLAFQAKTEECEHHMISKKVL